MTEERRVRCQWCYGWLVWSPEVRDWTHEEEAESEHAPVLAAPEPVS